MDIDAYIIDYKNDKILYATENSSFLMGNRLEDTMCTDCVTVIKL